MNPESVRHVEAILLVAEEPVPAGLLAQVLELPVAEVREGLAALARVYEERASGFCLREVAGGWRYYSHPDSAPYVERFVLADENPRLSKAALETLAIVAYRQPVSRGQVAELRGVNSDAVMRTLVLRGLVEPVGADPGPGQATLYGTTRAFLERLGLKTIDDLPPLADFVPAAGDVADFDAVLGGQEPADGELAARVKDRIAALRRDLQRS
ncbi:MAG: SMC-Scp complex subunit ScpB [Acidimicrobiia bacterium]|nr:SMC-Scp complex subunit ScpB [Acidimicrobiia bacterium]